MNDDEGVCRAAPGMALPGSAKYISQEIQIRTKGVLSWYESPLVLEFINRKALLYQILSLSGLDNVYIS